MNNKIFADTAPKYWALNMPVMPIKPNTKRPFITAWQAFCQTMPGVELRDSWVNNYPDYNIGLPLGPQSGVVVVDIDTDDQEIIDLVEAVCGKSPWHRRGSKGFGLAYRYNSQKTCRIKTKEGKTLVEILSTGTQVILPPSIHPDTHAPYVANDDLARLVKDNLLPILPNNIEMALRTALQDTGVDLSASGFSQITEWTPAGSRDNQMTGYAGLLAHSITRGEHTLLETFDMMQAWHENCQEFIAGDDVNLEKGKAKIVEFLMRDVLGDKKRPLPRGWDKGLTEEDKVQFGLVLSPDTQEWSSEEFLEWLTQEFEEAPQGSPRRIGVIQTALNRIARSPSMSTLDIDRILHWISNTTSHITYASLRRQLREIESGDLIGADHSEIAQAVIKDLKEFGDLRYHNEKFYQWGGSHWCVLPEQKILAWISEHFGTGLAATKRHSDHKGILMVMSSLLNGPLKDEKRTQPGVNFANGYLTMEGDLIEHDSRFGCTYTLPFRYIPETSGTCFKFQQFLLDSWGQDDDYTDKLSALQEAICATTLGLATRFQRAFLLYGVPGSGKSVLLEIVQELMPDEARCLIPPADWADRFLPEKMGNKLINIAGELSENKKIPADKFKSIVVGETMTVQAKGKTPYEMRPKCAHWFASNHLPKTADRSNAFNRRWLIFCFNKPVSVEKRDVNLALKIISEEREAIMAWALEALPRVRQDNFRYTLPKSHESRVREMASMNNSVRYFFWESGKVEVVAPGSKKTTDLISEDDLYSAYYTFCLKQANAQPVTPRSFKQLMREIAAEEDLEMKEESPLGGGRSTKLWFGSITLVEPKIG